MHWKMNTYCPLIKIYLCQKIWRTQDLPKRSTYTSPTLKFLFKKLTYFIQPRTRSILTKLIYGMGPHFPGASQWADTANWI